MTARNSELELARLNVAIEAVAAASYGTGVLDCPKCGNYSLNYSKQSGRRGDVVRANCSTPGCLRFMS